MLKNHMPTTCNSYYRLPGQQLSPALSLAPCSFALPTTSGSRSVKPMSMPEDQESLSVLVGWVECFNDLQWIDGRDSRC
jgi:hypothetical protein